jgi:hypothetical protein
VLMLLAVLGSWQDKPAQYRTHDWWNFRYTRNNN